MAPSPSSIINSDFATGRSEWKRFVCGIVLMIGIPVLIILLVAEFVCWRVGETVLPTEAAEMQTANPTMIWYNYRDSSHARFKLARVAIERPDILILGESRTQEFRSAMFHPYTCYNLSSVCYTIGSYADVLRHLPAGYNPKVIIFSLDFFIFNPDYNAVNAHHLSDYTPEWKDNLGAVRDILVELPTHPGLVFAGRHNASGEPTLGLGAAMGPMGFRKDGSTQWGWRHGETSDSDLLNGFQFGKAWGAYADAIDPAAWAQFEDFVHVARARGIQLVGVQMPMYGPLVERMEHADAAHYGSLRDLQNRIATGAFDRDGVLAFDYLNFPGYSEDYHYMIDQIHPKEALTLAVLRAMTADPRFHGLLPALDTAAMDRKLDDDRHATLHGNLYPNEF